MPTLTGRQLHPIAEEIDRAPRLGERLLDRMGGTPLRRLDRVGAHLPGVQLLAKAERANPGGYLSERFWEDA
jgi:hypothetical protein